MDRLLCLCLWMSLSIAADVDIKCYHCLYQLVGKKCLVPHRYCTLQNGESCFRQAVFLRKKPLYVQTGCLLNCNQMILSKDISHVSKCCSGHSFCNA